MSHKLRFFGGLFLLLMIICFFLLGLNYVCNPYNEKADRVTRGLYSEEKIFDKLDVALIGGSHGANGFNPHEIYKNYGLTAFNFSLSGEPIYTNYYYLVEMFKTKKPKVVVLDLYYLGMKNEEFSCEQYVFDVARSMKYNMNRLDMIWNSFSGWKEKICNFLPFIQYHDRFDELTKQDFLRKPEAWNDYLLGSQYYFVRNAGTDIHFETWDSTTKAGGINKRNLLYLQKIIDLVKENGCELLFVDLPHNHVDSGAPDEWVENEYQVMNQAKEIASKNQVGFLQYDDDVLETISFVPEEDMYNRGHMNYWGSVKVSNYLGEYLKEHYSFDGKNDCKKIWDSYMELYDKDVKKNIDIQK